MAILNKNTSIGDIDNVYDRLKSITPWGGGITPIDSNKLYVYDCIDGDNSSAIYQFVNNMSGTGNTLIINADPTQTITFNSGIDCFDNTVTTIIFNTPEIKYNMTSNMGFISCSESTRIKNLHLIINTTGNPANMNIFNNHYYENSSGTYACYLTLIDCYISGDVDYNILGYENMVNDKTKTLTLSLTNSYCYTAGSASKMMHNIYVDGLNFGYMYNSVLYGFDSIVELETHALHIANSYLISREQGAVVFHHSDTDLANDIIHTITNSFIYGGVWISSPYSGTASANEAPNLYVKNSVIINDKQSQAPAIDVIGINCYAFNSTFVYGNNSDDITHSYSTVSKVLCRSEPHLNENHIEYVPSVNDLSALYTNEI